MKTADEILGEAIGKSHYELMNSVTKSQLRWALEEYRSQEPQQKGYSEGQMIDFVKYVSGLSGFNFHKRLWREHLSDWESKQQSLPQPNKQESDK